MVTNPVNQQWWAGMDDPKFGYGALRHGFTTSAPEQVRFSPHASSVVYMGIPDHFPGAFDGCHKSLFTMVETDRVPDGWLPFLPEFDQIIVPCEANVEVFGRVHPNVVKVPLGVNREVWFPAPFLPSAHFPNARFRFHCGGSLWKRKGLDLVLQAFLRLGVDAELHIKVAPHCQDMPKIAARHDVVVHRNWMAEWELANWTRLADCWVAPSRGEGFGLMPLQSIACGVPTILSDTSGHREYAHLATAVVPTTPVSADSGMWDECSVDDLAEAMRKVYENAQEAQRKVITQSTGILDWTWEKASQRLLDVLPRGVLLPTDTPFIPCQPKVTVQIGKTCAPDIAGKKYKFIAGNEYTVPVNVRDVLSVSGHLIV